MSGTFGTNWFDLSSISNKCISTYYRGFVDISGGPLYLRNNNLYIQRGDVSLNGNLFVSGDLSLNNGLSLGGQLAVRGDVSLNGNVYAKTLASTDNSNKVATTAFVQSVSLISSTYYTTDVSMTARLYVGGDVSMASNLSVAGTLSKGGGSFDIKHPDPSKPAGSRLRHCFVESPTRGDNIYRYRVEAVDLSATLMLPSYYKFLNEDTQILVTPIDCFGSGFGTLGADGETISIRASVDGQYNVIIIGTRKDQMMIDFFDNNGGVEYSESGLF